VQIYTPDDQELSQRHDEMNWVERIHRAIDEDRFQLYRQIILPLKAESDNRQISYELLVRMEDNGSILTPAAFMAPAERFGLMPNIDRWVVRTALAWMSSHQHELNSIEFITINLSGHSIGDEHFSNFIVDTLRQFDVPAEKIFFEITETAAVHNLELAANMMRRLRKLGVRFALDDFGSGMSSFGYLKNLPVDILKIDGSFVKDLLVDPMNMAMVRAINDIGQVLGKETIAEYVETDTIQTELAKMGVDYAQGFGIGRPEALPE